MRLCFCLSLFAQFDLLDFNFEDQDGVTGYTARYTLGGEREDRGGERMEEGGRMGRGREQVSEGRKGE